MAIVLSGSTGIDAGSLPVANTGKISAGAGLSAILNTAGVDRVIVDTAGNVGIGTSSPTQQLHVRNTSGNCNIIAQYGTGNYGGVLASANGTYLTQNGNTVALMDSSNNFILTSGTGGLGYGTGSGGTVTQLTNKSTAVTLNKPTGKITMNNAALAAGATVNFVLYSNVIGKYDQVICNPVDEILTDQRVYRIRASSVESGYAWIRVTNESAASLSEAIQFTFSIIKGANA